MIDDKLRHTFSPISGTSDWRQMTDLERIDLVADKLMEVILEVNRLASLVDTLVRKPLISLVDESKSDSGEEGR